MTESSKPREFWILTTDYLGKPISRDLNRECYDYEPETSELEQLTHVIEKSAHDVALARIAELEEENKNLKTSLTIQREACEAIDDNGLQAFRLQQQNQALNSRIKLLEEAILDADFILEGSRALSGQSDELLERRENALMRFLKVAGEIQSAREKIGGGE